MMIFAFFLSFIASATDQSFKATIESMQSLKIINARSTTPVYKHEVAHTFKTPYLQDELKVGLSLQPQDSDLVVMTPGTFGGYTTSPEMDRMGDLLFQKGYSLLRFPNPQSSHVVKLKPNFSGLDFETEAELYKYVIEQVQKAHNFKKIHLIGVSYGGFVTAVMAKKMGDSFDGQVVLISPPKNLASSLTQIDSYFDELKEEITPLPWGHIPLYLKMKWSTWMQEPFELSTEEAKSLVVVSGFHNQSLQLRQMAGKGPKGGFLSALFSRRNWSKKNKSVWHMIPTLKKEYPQFFKRPEKHEVLYWFDTQKNNWHVYTTTDDFINPPNIWPEDSHITVFKEPGHVFSYLLHPEFEKSFLSRF